jgi:ABC-2 type transport system permease protein
MASLFLLTKPRLLGVRNQLIRSKGAKRNRILILGGLGLAFCGGLYLLSCRVLAHFQSVDVIGDLLARHLLSMIFLTFFSLLIFSHIITALSNLYLSKDLKLFHASPVPLEKVFVSRALYTLMDSSWMLIVFGMPIFMAYGHVYGGGLGFYVSLFHLSLALACISAGIGIPLTMALIYIFPAQRARDLILPLSLLLVVALYLLFRFMRPERLADPESFFTVVQYLSALRVLRSPYLPTEWVTGSLWDILTGSGARNQGFLSALTWSTAGALAVINIWLARAIYFVGFSKAQEAKKRSKRKRVLDLLVKGLTRPYGEDLAAVIAKDIRTFFRDNSQWSQLLVLAALVIVYIYNFSVLPLEKTPVPIDFLRNELAFLNMGLAGFVLSAVSARFIFPAVSGEGGAYWILRSSPLSPRRYLWGKYLFFVTPMLFLAEMLIVLTNWLLNVTLAMMIFSASTMFIMVFGIVSLGVGLGALYPQFKYENIAQVATGFGGVLYMIISSIFIGVVILLEAGPVYVLFASAVRGNALSTLEWCFTGASFSAALLVNGLAVFKPMRMGLKALNEYE